MGWVKEGVLFLFCGYLRRRCVVWGFSEQKRGRELFIIICRGVLLFGVFIEDDVFVVGLVLRQGVGCFLLRWGTLEEELDGDRA